MRFHKVCFRIFWGLSLPGFEKKYPKYYLLIIFRDNGITIQILTYQLYAELFLFLTGYIRSQFFIPVDFFYKLTGIISTFAMFVILPLFYLNGDANFRNRVLQQGLWKALKRSFFKPIQKFIQSNNAWWVLFWISYFRPYLTKQDLIESMTVQILVISLKCS